MSHRIIEKRRRDRMNNCLADLSRLVPTNYLKKGRGRIEKTEIIEMAIKHLKHLQAHPCKDPANCEVAKTADQDQRRQYRFGYTECMNEALRFVGEAEGVFADSLCARLAAHLQKHYEKAAGEPKPEPPFRDAKPPSQLREMLQNPDLPKGAPRQDVYKFKNTIKHRFHADARHRGTAPHSPSPPPAEGPPPPLLCAEPPYGHHFPAELSVKIPWDETGSSCGSNSSPPPNAARSSNGSSSGYSTNGEPGKPKGVGSRSPTLSPYSPPEPGVPVFALHPKGAFYVPLTLEASLLVPHLAGADELSPVLHPVSICVNLGAHSLKVEKPLVQSFLVDKFHEHRLLYERHPPYYPDSPPREGCS